jgi:hypothetical protein
MRGFRIMKTLQKFGSARSRPSHTPGFRGLLVLGLVCLSAFSPIEANAEVAVDGDRDQTRVSVDNDTVGRALEALGQKENLQYHSAAPLNKVIGGSFSGSLGHVLSRILVGFDFVVHYSPQGVEIFVYGESGGTATPPAAWADASPRPRPAWRAAQRAAVGLNAAPRNAAPHAASP